jgi:lipoprotein signal peptidase
MILNTKKRDIRSRLVPLILSAGIIILDQVTKLIVLATVPKGAVVRVIDDFFRIINVQNPAIAFSIGRGIEAGARQDRKSTRLNSSHP